MSRKAKELPHSVTAEMGVLGSCILDSSRIGQCVQKIRPEFFYVPAHQSIYNVLVTLWNNDKPADLITLTQHLRDIELLESVGGAQFITSLVTFVPCPDNIDYYLDIVREKFVLREIISIGTDGIDKAQHLEGEVTGVLSYLQDKILGLSEPMDKGHRSTEQFASDALQQISEAYENKGKMPGLSTGLIDLDRKLGGLKPPQFVVISGDTGKGKTALALKIAEHNGIHQGVPVGILSLEMGGVELCDRWIASLARVDMHKFLTYGGQDSDFPRITAAVGKLQSSKIIVRDDADVDALQMRAIARQLKAQHKIQILIVDYIQLMNQGKSDSKEQEIAAIAQAMKNCAKELEIVFIGMSQVNDEGRLRDSRAIGFHADKVIRIEHTEEGCYLNIRKNRNGPVGPVPVAFLRDYATFESLSRHQENVTN